MDPITGLAIGRITLGAVSFLSPGLAARMFLPAEARRWLRTLEQAWLGWR